jgi:hypothetical protein
MPKKAPKKTEFDTIHMTENQIKETKDRINSAENMLKDTRPWVRNKITDEEGVRKTITADKKLLENHVPRKLRGQKANRAYTEAKKLAEKIKAVMPSGNQYFQRYPKDSDGHTQQADFEKVVAQQVKFQSDPKIQEMIIRYKNIVRRLDPSDPTIANIEALRD